MPNQEILKKSTILLGLMIYTGLAWAGNTKNNNPPPRKPAPQVKAVPAPKPAPVPSRPATQQPTAHKGQGSGKGGAGSDSGKGGQDSSLGKGGAGSGSGKGGHGPDVGKGEHGPDLGKGGHGPDVGKDEHGTDVSKGGHGPGSDKEKIQNVSLKDGTKAQVIRRPGGGLADIHTTNGMTIHEGVHGERAIVTERNGRTIVSDGRYGGHVQRPYFSRGGRSYYARTYVRDGRRYSRVYREYHYGGRPYYGYVHDRYYHPGYYGWAYHPWGRIYYGPAVWGWAGAPWYRFYGAYFTPYPVYASPAFWLTDYLIATNLQAAYQAGVGAGQVQAGGGATPPPEAGTQTPLSPEVKQAIADEVQQQLAAEQAAVSNPNDAPSGAQVPDALNPAERVFVVASDIDTALPNGQECGLTGGDVLMRITDKPDENQNVTASVQSSKKGDCANGQTVAVSVQDLQEMHNHFQEQLDSGLQTLADNAGKNGLPTAPDTNTTSGEITAPPPDADAVKDLQAQQQQANQVEAQVRQGSQNTI